MFILLALIASIAVGIGLHFLLPHRGTRGVMLTPGVAGIAVAALYTLLTWLQWGEGNIWLWVVSIGGSIVATIVVTVVLGIVRTRHDTAERERLGIA